MKKFITVILSLFIVFPLFAQKREDLSAFTAIDVNARIQLKLVKLKESETPYIIYDTKEAKNTRFSFGQKNGVLKIRERHDSKQEEVTEITVGFNTLTDITIAKADVKVSGILTSQLLDIYISNDANFTAEVDVLDIMVFASGKSRVEISGSTEYHTADISSAHYNAQNLESMCTVVESAHNAVVRVNASDRLQMQTATGGKIYYHAQPVLLRSRVTTFGGDIAIAK